MTSRIVGLSESSVFRPGIGNQPSYTASNIRYSDVRMTATLQGGYPADSVDAPGSSRVTSIYRDLEAGECIDHPGVGTFTLMYVNPIVIPFAVGGGPTATFQFVPAPGFIAYWDKESEVNR